MDLDMTALHPFTPMANFPTSDTLGLDVAKAIGLSTNGLVAFSLHFKAQELVKCEAEYLVCDADTSAFVKSMQTYQLVPIND